MRRLPQPPHPQRRPARRPWARALAITACAGACLLGGADAARAVDSDGLEEGGELNSGSDPIGAASLPPPGFESALFEASFILHAFGNDVTTGATYPFDTEVFFALPLGTNCQHASPSRFTWDYTTYTGHWVPNPYYCSKTTLQLGQPATGSGLLGIRGGAPASLWLSTSAFGATATGHLRTDPPYIVRHTYAAFVNAPGSFFAGGGPAAGKGVHTRSVISKNLLAGRWVIREGANALGGAMGLLGKLRAAGRWTIPGTTGTYDGASSWNMIKALGRSRYATVIGCTPMGAPLFQNLYTNTGRWYKTTPKGKVRTDTITAVGSGTLWTTGTVTVRAPHGFFTTTLRRAGYDNRKALGYGNIQLVTPALTHWFGRYRPDSHTGHIGILKLQVVPEPGALVLLAAGVGLLLALRRWTRRGKGIS